MTEKHRRGKTDGTIRGPEILGSLFRISRCSFHRGIWPWIQNGLCPGHWRFYWNPVPGGVLRIGESEVALEKDFFYLLPPFLHFSTAARQPFDQFFVHFHLYAKRPQISKLFRIPADPAGIAQIRKIIELGQAWETLQMRTLLVHALLSNALLHLPGELFRLERCPDPRIERICKFLEEPSGKNRTNNELAEELHMSRNSFIRLFHQETGDTPQRYRRRKCIEKACGLLRSADLSIGDIAEASGFSDRSHFTRIFTQIIGLSPGSYRKRFPF